MMRRVDLKRGLSYIVGLFLLLTALGYVLAKNELGRFETRLKPEQWETLKRWRSNFRSKVSPGFTILLHCGVQHACDTKAAASAKHYAMNCGEEVNRVVVVSKGLSADLQQVAQQFPKSIRVEEVGEQEFVSSTFLPRSSIETHAVFFTDGAESLSCSVLETIFRHWNLDQEAMVGMKPILITARHQKQSRVMSVVQPSFWAFHVPPNGVCRQGAFNAFDIGKGTMLHRRFLGLYFDDPAFEDARRRVNRLGYGEEFVLAFVHKSWSSSPDKVIAVVPMPQGEEDGKLEESKRSNVIRGQENIQRQDQAPLPVELGASLYTTMCLKGLGTISINANITGVLDHACPNSERFLQSKPLWCSSTNCPRVGSTEMQNILHNFCAVTK